MDSVGLRRLDIGQIVVIDSKNYIIDLHESVKFKKIKNYASEKNFSVETWQDEICYRESIPIRKEHIEIKDKKEDNKYCNNFNKKQKKVPYLKYILLLLIPIIFLLIYSNLSNRHFIANYLKEDSSYIYYTSITSDTDSKLKADVYYTKMSMDKTAEFILNASGDRIEDIQSSKDKYSVAILTKYEYALVYIGKDNKTYIQISPREYVYTSNNDLYNYNYRSSNMYYRDFYYTFGYLNDSNRYKNRVSPYSGYTGNKVNKKSSDKHSQLKSSGSSIKQSSVSSRSSSGGGLSSGK